MTHLEFLRSPSIARMIARAGTGAGVPVSVHYVKRNQEGTRVCGWGQCEACRQVSALPGGSMACRLSRTTASTMAIRQQRPVSFVCHLGLACVCIAPFSDEGYVITLGPFCPMEEQRSLESDVAAGFAALGEVPKVDEPVNLADVTRLPAASVPAIAEWLLESLGEAWTAAHSQHDAVAAEGGMPPREALRSTGSGGAPVSDGIVAIAQDVGAALAAEQFGQARRLLLGHMEEFSQIAKGKDTVQWAHLSAVVGETLTVMGRAGIAIEGAQKDHAAFATIAPGLSDQKALVDEALRVFNYLRQKASRSERTTALPHYPELYAVVKDRLLEGVTLDYVASVLDETPSAISHRLKRKFGMSFSDYVGRIRIEKAKKMIRETHLNATEIAQRVGIADQSNFGKIFKKFAGVTPANYRKAHGKSHE